MAASSVDPGGARGLGANGLGAIDSNAQAGSLWTNAWDVPSSQELNPYSYVLNNPIEYSDPTGFAATNVPTFEQRLEALVSFTEGIADGAAGSVKEKPGDWSYNLGALVGVTLGLTGDAAAATAGATAAAGGAAATPVTGPVGVGVAAAGTAAAVAAGAMATKHGENAGQAIKNLSEGGSGADSAGTGSGKKATDAGKNSRHGDLGRAQEKVKPQLDSLKEQLKTATGRDKTKIKAKIQNIERTAAKKKKGTEHTTRKKR